MTAYRSVTKRRGIDATVNRDRILAATEEVIREGRFATATVADIAERAEVSRATVFSQFGSKLGILEALAVRCSGGPQMLAIREAVALDDATRVLDALVEATCEHWEIQGHILLTLKAVSELEPGALTLIDEQRVDQRDSVARVVDTMRAAGPTGPLSRAQLIGAMHLLTSVESFMELRRGAGLSMAATKAVLKRSANALFDPA